MAKRSVDVVVRARDNASRKFGRIGKAAARMGKMLKKAAIGVGVVATGVGVGLAYMIKQQMKNIDVTAKLADRLNMATEDITALQLAAELAGSSADTFNKSIEVMIRRLGEVKLGVGQAKYALNKLGLDVDDLIDKDPALVFEQFAKEIAKLPSAADKATVAYYLMGRRGMELLNLMERLEKEGLAAVRAEAEKLGITFSRLDAAKVEAANDAMTRLNAVLTGVSRTLAIELSPVLEAAIDEFVEMGTEGEGMGDKVVNAFEAMTKSVLYFSDSLFAAKELSKGAAAWWQRLTPVGFLYNKLQGGGDPVNKWLTDLADKKTSTEKADEFFARLREKEEQLKAERDARAAAGGSGSDSSAGAVKVLDMIEKTNKKLKEQVELYGLTARAADLARLKKLGKGFEGKELEFFNLMLADIEKNMTKLGELDVFAKLKQSAKDLVESLKTPVEKFKDLREEYKKLLDAGLITSEQFEKALQNALSKIAPKKNPKQPQFGGFSSAGFLTMAPGTRSNYDRQTAANTRATANLHKQELQVLKKISGKLGANPREGNQTELTVTNFP